MTPNSEFNWKDASSGERLYLYGNQVAMRYLTFDFPFYDQTFRRVYISENGFICFGTGHSSPQNEYFPSSKSIHRYMIAPFWDDVNTYYYGGDVYIKSFTGCWVVQWDNVFHQNGYRIGSFQIILYITGEIVFNYKNLYCTWEGYTCGLNYGLDTNYYIGTFYNLIKLRFFHLKFFTF